jgi:hypothetical protein
MWRAVGIAFQSNGGDSDDRGFGQPPFQIVVPGLALSQREPPPVVMDHDGDVIRIVEGRGTAIERRIIELPLR